ncbi:MAG: succinate dehydrogenase, cytochrome b556 subunit [Pantoea sp. Brub]|nr:succinate dehydrogenase, cytochrome b556 subunit [Pantoea sp. Brub]
MTIRFPITAISSILHRISGIIILFTPGIMLWILHKSLSSPKNFKYTVSIINNFYSKIFLWGISIILIYHLISGIRHLVMDFGFLIKTFKSGVYSSYVAFIITLILSILIGVFIW